MGWGLIKSQREQVIGTAIVSEAPSTCDVAVADMNAKIRQKAVVDGLSVQRVVRNVVREVVKGVKEHVVLIFDDARPGIMPDIRTGLWKKRYAAATEITSAAEEAVKKHCEDVVAAGHAAKLKPPPYAHMFAPGNPKKLTWNAVATVAKREAAVAAAEARIRVSVIDPQGCTFDSSGAPPAIVDVANTYGEADLKVYAVAQHFAAKNKSVIIHSVDTDLILQAVATVNAPQTKSSKEAWCPTAPMHIRLKGCTVDARKLVRFFGGSSKQKRTNTAFWFIMAGGTDYTAPASDQGFAKKSLADAAHPLNITDAPFTQRGPADVYNTLKSLKKTRRVARTVTGAAKKSGRTLKHCIMQAAAVTAYYALENPHPDPALF